MAATKAHKAQVRTQLASIVPDGGTDHMLALRAALKIQPEVIFFLTDADLMTNGDVTELLAEARSTRIQAIEFGRGIPSWICPGRSSAWPRRPAARTATSTSPSSPGRRHGY